jgi:D-serine deaminase-like pyridoxal phosphate-dependent protein
MQQPPAEPGMSIEQVDTPALLVDLDPFERNLARMARLVDAAGVRLRAHAKTHKCAAIARRQMALGAVGVCCQKVSEAEALVDAGVADVLVSNQVVGERKLARLAELAARARLGVCVDHAQQVSALEQAVGAVGSELWVLVEVDVGAGRCGVAPGAPAVALARQVADAAGLSFAGLQAYHGSAQHIRSFEERRAAVDGAIDKARCTIEVLDAAGLACETVAGAGTGSFRFESVSGVYNELQCGSYVFMDADYAKNLDASGQARAEFEHSLFVLATVMSAAKPDYVVVDAGLKSLAFDAGPPIVHEPAGSAYARPSDEHGRIDPGASNVKLTLGDRVQLIPGHCDPTVNLHDWYVAVRDGVVEELWRVDARGGVF